MRNLYVFLAAARPAEAVLNAARTGFYRFGGLFVDRATRARHDDAALLAYVTSKNLLVSRPTNPGDVVWEGLLS